MHICPECSGRKIETFVDKADFGQEKDIYIPIRACKKCGFQWIDRIGEEIVSKTLQHEK